MHQVGIPPDHGQDGHIVHHHQKRRDGEQESLPEGLLERVDDVVALVEQEGEEHHRPDHAGEGHAHEGGQHRVLGEGGLPYLQPEQDRNGGEDHRQAGLTRDVAAALGGGGRHGLGDGLHGLVIHGSLLRGSRRSRKSRRGRRPRPRLPWPSSRPRTTRWRGGADRPPAAEPR